MPLQKAQMLLLARKILLEVLHCISGNLSFANFWKRGYFVKEYKQYADTLTIDSKKSKNNSMKIWCQS